MTGVILAGGENRRFPYPKGLIPVDGIPIVERIMTIFVRHCRAVMISTNAPQHYFRFGVPLVGDVVDERGPMTGILSVMTCSSDTRFFITACDMPYPEESLIRLLIARDSGANAVIPVYRGEPQPLFGIYHRRLIDTLYAKISGRKKGMKRFLTEINTEFVGEGDVLKADPEGRSFMNINTIDDFNALQGGVKCSG